MLVDDLVNLNMVICLQTTADMSRRTRAILKMAQALQDWKLYSWTRSKGSIDEASGLFSLGARAISTLAMFVLLLFGLSYRDKDSTIVHNYLEKRIS
jgi:hypothetical protein